MKVNPSSARSRPLKMLYNNFTMRHSDKPVQKLSEDSLGRKNFAIKLAHDIANWNDTESLVIGLYGKWGDGKTSVINFIKDLYENPSEINIEKNSKSIPTIIEFNPWFFSNSGSIIQNFLLEVGKELGQSNSEIDRQIANKIGMMRLYLEPVSTFGEKIESWMFRWLLPVLGLTLVEITDRIVDLNSILYWTIVIVLTLLSFLKFANKISEFFEDFYRKRSNLNDKTLNQIKEEVKEKLLERGQKILFIIDDVDRLTPDEVKVLFQLVKINLDLPNLIYLISMDVSTVGKMLTTSSINGDEYIEKIVQIPVPLPKASEEKISQFLFNELDALLKFFSKEKWDQERWSSIYRSGLGKIYLKRNNLRIIKRTISQMSVAAKVISKEVDAIDFICIRTLENFYPDLYHFISNNKEIFTTSNTHSEYQKRKLDDYKKTLEIELSKVEPYIKDFLLELFQPLKSNIENYSYGQETDTELRKNRRVSSPEYFDSYFYLDVPDGEFSSNELNSIISISDDYNKLIDIFNSYLEESKDIRKLFKTILDFVDELPRDVGGGVSFMTALFDIYPKVSEMRSLDMFDFGGAMDVMRLTHFYLKSLKNEEMADEIVRESIDKTTSLSAAVNLLSLNDRRDRDGTSSTSRDWTISKEVVASLESKLLGMIKTAARKGILDQEPGFANIIYRWKEWGSVEDVLAYVQKLVKTNKGLANFISGFISNNLLSTTKSTELLKRINIESMKEFFDVDHFYEKIKKAKTDSFTNKQKEAFRVYLECYENKDNPRF